MGTKLTQKEIEEQLDKKDISLELKTSLLNKKNILLTDKVVKK